MQQMDVSNPRRALALSLSSQAHHLSRVDEALSHRAANGRNDFGLGNVGGDAGGAGEQRCPAAFRR